MILLLSAVKTGLTFFSGSKLVYAWCFETILITNYYIFGSNKGASGKRWSAETEVQKWKEKLPISNIDSRMSFRTECVCWGLVDKRGFNLCDVKAGFSALRLRRVSLSQCACDSQTQTTTNGECMGQPCGLYAPGMSWQWCRCECCHGCSPMAQPATKLLQRH